MILQVLLWRIVGCWIVAAVAAALDVWRASARDGMPAPSFGSGVRICIRYGVVLTIGMIFVAGFDSVDKVWDFRLKTFSYDLGAYSGYVRQAVLLGFAICFMVVSSLAGRLLDKLVPNDLANRTPTLGRGT